VLQTDLLSLGGQPSAFVIVEAGPFAQLFLQDSNFLLEILHNALLIVVYPPYQADEENLKMRLDGRLLDLVLPPQLPLKVVDTAPPTRGGADGAWKEAKLETGLHIMVPLFIANGEIVRVDTAGKKYLGKATSGG
jgi:elongation factor P